MTRAEQVGTRALRLTVKSGVGSALRLLKDPRDDGEAAALLQHVGGCQSSERQQRPLNPPVKPCISPEADGVFTSRFSNDPLHEPNQHLFLLLNGAHQLWHLRHECYE
jgi:hypothetical protein